MISIWAYRLIISLNKSKILVTIDKTLLGYDKNNKPKYDVKHNKKEMSKEETIQYTTIRRDYMEKYKYNEANISQWAVKDSCPSARKNMIGDKIKKNVPKKIKDFLVTNFFNNK